MSENLSKLSNADFAKAKADFLKHQRQVARTERLSRQAVHRTNAPKPEELSRMGAVEFEKAERNFLKNLR